MVCNAVFRAKRGDGLSIVPLLSGGLDSCLMTLLIQETGKEQKPLFINYGQLNANHELNMVNQHCEQFTITKPVALDISLYGKIISSGITNSEKDIVDEAFLPGRNMLLLLAASSFAVQNNCAAVSIGLLKEETAIFPDQTNDFLFSAEYAIEKALGERIEIVTPLRDFYKKDVIDLASSKGIVNYYSCHAGGQEPCGKCISCLEFKA